MSVLGIGVDLVEVERIQHSLDRFGERFMNRVFTEGEIVYCQSMKFPARHFAARFAAKEAVSKAFGTGIGKAMGWRDIDVHKKESGEPFLVLHGGAEVSPKSGRMKSAWISLSHTEHHAVAMVVIEGSGRISDLAVPAAKAQAASRRSPDYRFVFLCVPRGDIRLPGHAPA